MLFRNVDIEHSKFCVEGMRCSAIHHAARGVWLCVCVVSGVIAESLLFFQSQLTTVNNGNWGGAAVFAVGVHQYWRTNAYIANVEAQATEKTFAEVVCTATKPVEAGNGWIYNTSSPTEGPGWTNALSILSKVNRPIWWASSPCTAIKGELRYF